MSAGSYAAIILAAGLSSRLPQFKPLLPLGGETITDHLIHTFLNCGVEVLLVVGHRQEELRAGIKKHNMVIIENPGYRQGMFTSVQAGIRGLQPGNRAFFIMPADIPLVREATVRQLLSAAGKAPEKIVYPVFNGKRGHPPLIPSSHARAILSWHGENGLKSYLKAQKGQALEVPVADGNILFDVDTPDDYRELSKRYQRDEILTNEERGD